MNLKSIGNEKDKEFAPDERIKKLLEEGVKIGDAITITNAYSHMFDSMNYLTPTSTKPGNLSKL